MRRVTQLLLTAALALAALDGGASAAEIDQGKSYKGPTGLQLYSLRAMFKEQGVAAALIILRCKRMRASYRWM